MQQDFQAMLYTLALKFLKSNELEQVKEVIKMTELGRMLREDGKIDVVRELLKEGLLTKEQIAKVAKLSIKQIEEIEESIVVS